MNTIRSFLDTWKAIAELRTAEIRAGITLIEAAQADEFETQLRTVTTTAAERDDIRKAAIELAKCGGRAADVAPAMRALAIGWIEQQRSFTAGWYSARRYTTITAATHSPDFPNLTSGGDG